MAFTFTDALALAKARFQINPNWSRLCGSPWENDAPVIAANLLMDQTRSSEICTGHFQALWDSECKRNDELRDALRLARDMLHAIAGDIEDGHALTDLRGKYVLAVLGARDAATAVLEARSASAPAGLSDSEVKP